MDNCKIPEKTDKKTIKKQLEKYLFFQDKIDKISFLRNI